MFGLLYAQRPLKIESMAPISGAMVLSGVYRVVGVGGGGSGYNLNAFDSGLDGARGNPGALGSTSLFFSKRTVRSTTQAFGNGAGASVNAAPAAGSTGGTSVFRNAGLGIIFQANGGTGGPSTNSSPWSLRTSLPSGFNFDTDVGRGGNGAIGGAGGTAAQPGAQGGFSLEKIA